MKGTTPVAVGLAVFVALAVGVVGFALGRTTDGHMNGVGPGEMGHDMGRTMGSGQMWDGPMMEMGAMPGMSMTRSGTMAMGDQAFIAMMIPHHRMAIDMAKVVLDRGKDPETRKMAQAVIADQEAEIAQMREWHREWFGTEPQAMAMTGSMAMMGMGMDMDELQTSDEPDRVFLRMMIPHHAGALLMADMALAGSPREEVADLARRIVAAQSAEIGEMQRARERIAPPLG